MSSNKKRSMLAFDNSIEFVKGKPSPVAIRNFFPPEDGFIWSSGKWSELAFNFSGPLPKGHADLILELDAFKSEGQFDGQNVLIYFNGLRIGSYFVTRRTTIVIPVEAAWLKARDNVLTFDTPDSRRPSEFGIPDDRQLGIQLFSMQIRPAG